MDSGFLLLAVLGATALAQLAKFWVARPRPDMYAISLPMPADLSFPSAHSMQAAALALAASLKSLPPGSERLSWRIRVRHRAAPVERHLGLQLAA